MTELIVILGSSFTIAIVGVVYAYGKLSQKPMGCVQNSFT
ncbi:MAG: hypothetical protein DDT29_02583 [Dehalococcoidia bacterium]|nr:hypothetical protein [Bacillota bacterium]